MGLVVGKFDLEDDFHKRLAAMQHLRGQGFQPGEGDTFYHAETGATALLIPRKASEVNGRTLIAYDDVARKHERRKIVPVELDDAEECEELAEAA